MADTTKPATEDELEAMVREADVGGRDAKGLGGSIIAAVCIIWSLFQLWYASPLPFAVGYGIFDATEARAIHLAFALFLAFTAYPTFRSSPRDYVPTLDWVLAAVGALAAAYLFIFHQELADRPGQPTDLDLITAGAGMVLLLEATRRSLGMPMVCVALAFLFYTFAGPHMPMVMSHQGASLSKALNHQWITTEGVFGVALGVSTGFVFLFVLFGTLLDKAGAGNWMMQISIALLGHLRGGPAKVAVVSSALNGVVSGSSVSNVVSGGIFTIPLMKRTGLTGVKAGAIEAASSINGQIMPPVMGAAAFLMVEYVGIPYSQVVKHAVLPAVASYIALLYIVHLEALKINSQPIPRETLPGRLRLIRTGIGISGSVAVVCGLYYGVLGAQALFGSDATLLLAAAGLAVYLLTVWYAARFPDLEIDDPSTPVLKLPRAWDVTRTGLDYLIPIAVLLWCLMVEQLSPGLSAFWGTVTIMGITLTRRPLLALFRGGDVGAEARAASQDFWDGLGLGARNMISIAVATATAGIVVGTITLTGLGGMMTGLVEYISGGNVVAMLVLIAFASLVLGMGIPTTANYILISTLMAPVVVELGAQAGLVIPLIAVHLFVFYFGIMADITPPVGLAGFAAAAISREDPIATGFQGGFYALRTAILPFVFIFNPEMLLIGVDDIWHALVVIVISLSAILLFSAATMGWFMTRSRWWESLILLVVCFTLFRPDWWLNRFYPETVGVPPATLMEEVAAAPEGGRVNFAVEGLNLMGEEVRKVVSLRLGEPGDPKERLRAAGLMLSDLGGQLRVMNVSFGSYAKRVGLETGFVVTQVIKPAERPSRYYPIGIAFLVAGGIMLLQLRRRSSADGPEPTGEPVAAMQ